MNKKENPHQGSSLDEFLEAEGCRDEFEAVAVKETLARQISQEMKRQNITREAMAKRMNTSRSQLNRLLNPENEGVTLNTLQRVAGVLGKNLKIELSS